jgi:transcriptional regulator with XRE-family HTH domain
MGKQSATAESAAHVGAALRGLRQVRKQSQLDLALRTGVSQRHLSFIETGRAAPSRDMLVALMDALNAPMGQRNELMLLAGFAPLFAARPLDAPDMAPIRDALTRLLAAHEPLPALVIDADWTLVQANRGMLTLIRLLSGLPIAAVQDHFKPGINALKATLNPQGLRKAIINFDEIAAHLWHRLQDEAAVHPPLKTLMAEVEPWLPVSALKPGAHAWAQVRLQPVLTTRFQSTQGPLTFFSMFTTVGAPQDITAASLRVEHFFPADAATLRCLQEQISQG